MRGINPITITKRKLEMTKSEAIKIAGAELIDAVEEVNCDFTNRLTDGTEWAGYTEFSASVENDTHIVIAYYYQESDDLDGVEDLSNLSWEIDKYEVINI